MEHVDPEMAARQLAEIEARQERAVRRVGVPAWYWFAIGAGMVALGLVVDTQAAAVIVASALVFAALAAALTGWIIAGGHAGARVRRELLGATGAAGIVLLDWVVVGGSIGSAFALRAAGARYPATLGTLVGALLLVAGGLFLGSRLTRLMTGNLGR